MKIKLLFLLCFFSAQQLAAQTKATISGQIIEEATNQPLPFTTIALKTERDSTLVTGTLTEDNGRFTMANVDKGNYLVVCSFIGYEPIIVGVVVNGKQPIL